MRSNSQVRIPSALIDALSDDNSKTVFFLGAGASVESGLPTATKLAKAIRCKLEPRHMVRIRDWEQNNDRCVDLGSLAQICRDIDGNCDRFIGALPRGEWLAAEPHVGHLVLAELWAENLVWEPITTNIDNLIEKGFTTIIGKVGSSCSTSMHINRTQPRVFKMHGCLHDEYRTIWALDEITAANWDEAWKRDTAGWGLREAKALVFVGFREALPYLLRTFHEADQPQAYLVDPTPYEDFCGDVSNAGFMKGFGIESRHYIKATATEFFEKIRTEVFGLAVKKQIAIRLPHATATLDLPGRELEPYADQLLNQVMMCVPPDFQKLLKRNLLGAYYVPVSADKTREMLTSLLLIRLAYEVEVQTDRSEPVCYLLRNGIRYPLFVAYSEKGQRAVRNMALWNSNVLNKWPQDLLALLPQKPLVIVYGDGTLDKIGGNPNIATGQWHHGPHGTEPEFKFLHYDTLIDCIQPQSIPKTAAKVSKLIEQFLSGAPS